MINNIQKSNEGYYLCEAVNGIGSGLSAVILISVQGKLVVHSRTQRNCNPSTVLCKGVVAF